jgi:hypothetical protein
MMNEEKGVREVEAMGKIYSLYLNPNKLKKQ